MNTQLLYDQQFLIQQQILLSQLISFNQMMAMRQIPINSHPLFQQKNAQLPATNSPSETQSPELQTLRNDDTNLEQSSFQLPETKRISKTIKKIKESGAQKTLQSTQQTQKKVFLSMKDIKDVQYKKYKLVEETQSQSQIQQ